MTPDVGSFVSNERTVSKSTLSGEICDRDIGITSSNHIDNNNTGWISADAVDEDQQGTLCEQCTSCTLNWQDCEHRNHLITDMIGLDSEFETHRDEMSCEDYDSSERTSGEYCAKSVRTLIEHFEKFDETLTSTERALVKDFAKSEEKLVEHCDTSDEMFTEYLNKSGQTLCEDCENSEATLPDCCISVLVKNDESRIISKPVHKNLPVSHVVKFKENKEEIENETLESSPDSCESTSKCVSDLNNERPVIPIQSETRTETENCTMKVVHGQLAITCVGGQVAGQVQHLLADALCEQCRPGFVTNPESSTIVNTKVPNINRVDGLKTDETLDEHLLQQCPSDVLNGHVMRYSNKLTHVESIENHIRTLPKEGINCFTTLYLLRKYAVDICPVQQFNWHIEFLGRICLEDVNDNYYFDKQEVGFIIEMIFFFFCHCFFYF